MHMLDLERQRSQRPNCQHHWIIEKAKEYQTKQLLHWVHWTFDDVRVLNAQSCLNPYDPMECSSPGSFVHGIFQARTLEWVAISFLMVSSQPRDWTRVSHITGWFFNVWAPRNIIKFTFDDVDHNCGKFLKR